MYVYLGSQNCRSSHGQDNDFLLIQIHFKPHFFWCWNPSIDLEIWWRFTVGSRTDYILCDGFDCVENVSCSDDDDCSEIVGARCNDDNLCEIESALDVADYGFNAYPEGEDPASGWHAAGGTGACSRARSRFYRTFLDMAEDPYGRFFAPLLNVIMDETWTIPEREADRCLITDSVGSTGECTCDSDDDCFDLDSVFDVANRCNTDEGLCEVRPLFVYGINMYPNEMEFVLATDERPMASAILNSAGYCDEVEGGLGMTWSNDWL
jgi:hypothetical protein